MNTLRSSLKRLPAAFVPILAIALFSFGATMLLIGMAYAGDLESLRTLSEDVWRFVCGVPTQNPATLPLVIGVGAGTLLIGAGLLLLRLLPQRRS